MLKNFSLKLMSYFMVGMIIATEQAQAQITTANGTGANFSTIAENITDSLEALPGLLTGLSYLLGLLFGVLGIIKIKDHVENPANAKLADGAIRFAAGGALFGLPILYEAMFNTIGDTNNVIETPKLKRVEFDVRQ